MDGSATTTTIRTGWRPELSESVTSRVNVEDPLAVGVPVTAPVLVFEGEAPGREPPVTDQV